MATKKLKRQRRPAWPAVVLARIDELVIENPGLSARRMHEILTFEAQDPKRSFSQGDIPAPRTLQELITKRRRVVNPAEVWSVSQASLDDAAAILPVLQRVIKATDGKILNLTNAEAAEIRRIRSLVPDDSPWGLGPWDVFLLAREYVEMSERGLPADGADSFLAFAPWKGFEEAFRYEDALKQGAIPPRLIRSSSIVELASRYRVETEKGDKDEIEEVEIANEQES